MKYIYLDWLDILPDKLFCIAYQKESFKHGAILYNEAEEFSLSITNPNGQPMLPCDWLIQSSLILARCNKISAVEK